MGLSAPCHDRTTKRGSLHRPRYLHRPLALIFVVLSRLAAPLSADDVLPDRNIPLAIINVASVERLMNQALVTFEAAGRPELSETLGGLLERVNDLKGFDRNASVGVMVFLNGLIPEMVGYAPVKDLDEVLKTIEIGPITTKKTEDDRFEIVGRRKTFHGKVVADYAFIADNAAALDRNFRDPAALTARLARAYDLALTINLKSVVPDSKELFLGMLRAKSESDLQRRDNEPLSAHRLRKAAGMRNIELIEELLRQGEELTFGWSVSEQERSASLELVVTATPQSDLATFFNDLKGARSHFAGLLQSEAPLTAGFSWKLDRSAKTMLREVISTLEERLTKIFRKATDEAETTANEQPSDPAPELARALQTTIDAGHLDLAMQFVNSPSGAFVLVGGLRVVDGANLANIVADVLIRLKQTKAISDIQLNAFSTQGITFHRLEFKESRRQDEQIYGGKPGLYVGISPDVMWLAVGGDEVQGELERAITKRGQSETELTENVPLQFVMNFSRWMDVFDPKQKPDGFAALARNSFAKGRDALRIEARPIDNGLRFRLTMDEAFLRLIGQQIARQIDAQPEQRPADE